MVEPEPEDDMPGSRRPHGADDDLPHDDKRLPRPAAAMQEDPLVRAVEER